jgi:tetratricopeptide (TPR) repeat protein
MQLSDLFRKVVVGAAESSLDIAGNALLPVGWPIVKGALQPVLGRLKRRFNVEDVTATKEIAEAAADAFEQDQHLQETLRSDLQRGLLPVVEGQRGLSTDIELLMALAAGNTVALQGVRNDIRKLEQKGVKLRPAALTKLAAEIARQVAESQKIRSMIDEQIGGMSSVLIKRQAARIQLRAVELIREGQLDRAIEELREGIALVAILLYEAPTDPQLQNSLGYLYKAAAQACEALGDTEQQKKYVESAIEVFEVVKNNVPPDKKTAADIASTINGLGNIYSLRGEVEKALENYKLAVAICPEYAYAWHDMFAAYDRLARQGKLELPPMRNALQKVKETGKGMPGLGDQHIAQLDALLEYWERSAP